MKTLQFLLMSLILLIGLFAFFYLIGQFVLFAERFINPFIFAPLLVGIVVYGTFTILNESD